jgi:hypothetical protein
MPNIKKGMAISIDCDIDNKVVIHAIEKITI